MATSASPEPTPAPVVKRSLTIAGHATSISLEQPFWDALRVLAAREGCTLPALVAAIDRARTAGNLSSALRVHVLRDLQRRLGDRHTSPVASGVAPN